VQQKTSAPVSVFKKTFSIYHRNRKISRIEPQQNGNLKGKHRKLSAIHPPQHGAIAHLICAFFTQKINDAIFNEKKRNYSRSHGSSETAISVRTNPVDLKSADILEWLFLCARKSGTGLFDLSKCSSGIPFPRSWRNLC